MIFLLFQFATKRGISVIGLLNSGAIRVPALTGTISLIDVMEMLPFGNSIDLLQLKGKTIRNIIGKSAAGIRTSEDHKAFLQVSGKT